MPLLEVITHEGTAKDVSLTLELVQQLSGFILSSFEPQAAAQAVDLGYKQGKTVIVVKDVPGFYVNRCLGPFMTESMALVQDGVAPEKIVRQIQ